MIELLPLQDSGREQFVRDNQEAFRYGATKIVVAFHDLEITFDGSEARVTGWIDYSGTEAAWPRYEPKAEGFIARLEKTDGKWLFSRIKVP